MGKAPKGGISLGFLTRGAERIKAVPTGAQRLIKGGLTSLRPFQEDEEETYGAGSSCTAIRGHLGIRFV